MSGPRAIEDELREACDDHTFAYAEEDAVTTRVRQCSECDNDALPRSKTCSPACAHGRKLKQWSASTKRYKAKRRGEKDT